jgi:hypothetical protein
MEKRVVLFKNIGNGHAVPTGEMEVNGVRMKIEGVSGMGKTLLTHEEILARGGIILQGEQDYKDQTQLANTSAKKKQAGTRIRVNCAANSGEKKYIMYLGISGRALDLLPAATVTAMNAELAANEGVVTVNGDIKNPLKFIEHAIDYHGGITLKNILLVAHHNAQPATPPEVQTHNHLWQRINAPGDNWFYKVPENQDTKEKKFDFAGKLVTLDGYTFLRLEVNKGEIIEFIIDTEMVIQTNL